MRASWYKSTNTDDNTLVHRVLPSVACLQKPQEAHRRLIETLRSHAHAMRELSPVLRHVVA